MIEVRFHGRGGQGSVVASELLARAAFEEGKDVQAFPMFGVERRGAPVTAFTRIDDKTVRDHSKIHEPEVVIILDTALLEAVDVTDGLSDDGDIIINTGKDPSEMKLDTNADVYTVDASDIAVQHGLGSEMAPIVNTAILGGVSAATGMVEKETLIDVILEHAPAKNEPNAEAAKEAYDKLAGPYPGEKLESSDRTLISQQSDIPKSEDLLCRDPEDHTDLPKAPIADCNSEYLNKTGSWRTMRPIVDLDTCINCGECWKYCPDVAIFVEDEGAVVDLDFCKGCGICAERCPVDAIDMEKEEKYV
ncbi:MAG: 2-oxoacid:acceptor oxidoreductase family protein [Candidatus Thermoplasmatota archaeon]|nr:2-oxoacid:acceptor oxidoreductase family protein [Candidatus Thermoplasmatota archaeon]